MAALKRSKRRIFRYRFKQWENFYFLRTLECTTYTVTLVRGIYWLVTGNYGLKLFDLENKFSYHQFLF